MVLDDASPVGSDSFSDSAPVSDNDPYSSESPSSKALVIDVTKFPQPVPIIGRLLGYNSQFLSKLVESRIERASKILQRPITEDEATALAYWAAKQVRVISYSHPTGIAFGALRAYQTSNTFQFPFYKPEPGTFASLTWPSARIPLLSGPRAVVAWHATRLIAYGIVGNFVARILFTSYAVSIVAVGELGDPRLKKYTEAIAKLPQNARGKLPNESNQQRKDGGVQEKDASTIWKDRVGQSNTNANPEVDDYGGNTKSSENPAFENGVVSDLDAKNQNLQGRPRPRENRSGNFHMEKQAQSFDEDFDDASPTGGRGMEGTATAAGSAWERLRRQASTQSADNRDSTWPAGQAQQPRRPNQRVWRRDSQQHPQDRSATVDSFAYPNLEDERQLAREEAQKEFDARVEQERRGGDFSADGDKKRWQPGKLNR